MTYARLIVLLLAFEVLVTALVGLGIYFGFTVFPYMQPSVSTASGNVVQSTGFNATIPLYMPSLADLKVPYTYLKQGGQSWGIGGFVVSAAILALQSFVRGMYLGGLKGWAWNAKKLPLFACGRRYFKDMLKWTVFQTVLGVLTIYLTAVFIPFGLLLIIVLFVYSLTPYLIVLQECSCDEALSRAPRLFRRNFGRLFPLALLAFLCTGIISAFKASAPPWGYAVPLLAYACVGTLLIGALMRNLATGLKLDRKTVPEPLFQEVQMSGLSKVVILLLVPILVGSGIFAASGRHLSAFQLGSKQRLEGISYNANFSDVFYSSEQRYTAYEWKMEDYRISIKLPDLSGKRRPADLRGVADITWQINREVRTVSGNTTMISVEPVTYTSRLMYRLVRETADDGSVYYSSINGSASILPASEHPHDPLSVQMMISGDGNQIYVLQYPTRFDSSQVFRVSHDGKYLLTGTSQVNPNDFHTYWFSAKQNNEQLFDFSSAKNRLNYLQSFNRAYTALACAMQEGDGRMVVEILESLRRAGVQVKTPDRDEKAWTEDLRGRYEGASLQETLKLLTRAGVQLGYEAHELTDQSDDKIGVYRFAISFPQGMYDITYKESKADGKLLSVEVKDASI
ncbi:hypothetical protein [Paenibacillus albus]|uniref:Uncharacterized protein n=1 Tax=Paenibacillus albus TaxID=2495582 RepID=A0A3S9A779_9BACL|nr:hypothetical protein [Paenibacillus albus]AZN41608.1 hypothetical protein EJC50_19450 [Paenibacillus albus]